MHITIENPALFYSNCLYIRCFLFEFAEYFRKNGDDTLVNQPNDIQISALEGCGFGVRCCISSRVTPFCTWTSVVLPGQVCCKGKKMHNMWHCSQWRNNKHQWIKWTDGKCECKSHAWKRLSDEEKKEGVDGWREQIKGCNECAVILAVLISLFVYFSSHLPRHAVPQCFPSSLVRSYCCALMHVLGWCSCPGRFVSVCAGGSVSAYVCDFFFLLIKLLQWSGTTRVYANSSCIWPFLSSVWTHTCDVHTCPHYCSWWWMVLLPAAFKGQKGV